MKRRQFLKTSAAAGLVTMITPSGLLYSCKKNVSDTVEGSFLNPPSSAKPFTWWHWINGFVTQDGITRDLEAMAEVGIGGVQAFSAYMDMPHGDADYLSPLWIDLMQHAASECLRLGLEFDMHNCMGWSSSGGSWIPPELSMQQLVWSEASVEGGKSVKLQLEQPFKRLDYYRDASVVAFPSVSATEKINNWEQKANYPNSGFHPQIELDTLSSNDEISESAINPEEVIDISSFMDESGMLNWEAPEGNWTIIRFGHTTTGIKNRPSSGNGQGLECDKFSSEALDFHFNYMMEKLLPALKPIAENGTLGMLIDSYEVNLQNWTIDMPQEFENRSGYGIYKFMPVLAGRIVGDTNTSERFLWDFRKTCADMMAENYYDRFVELCRQNNIISSTEPYNKGPFDEMRAGENMDVNLGEFWMKTGHFSHSVKVASSIQSMNGKKIVGAEAFTGRPFYSKWQEYPFSMKTQGDFMYTMGLNRFIFHRYAHQPHPTAVPGMTMGQWGFHFERTNTWFYQGKKWLEYATRCQYMLQQGTFVGDVMCFTGEEAPGDDITMGALYPDIPMGYDFQFANRDILLHKVTVKDGRISLPDGLSFTMLLLPEKDFLTVELARKLKELVQQGMILSGPRPQTIPSLSNFSSAETEFKSIVEELWGAETKLPINRKVGAGRVFSNLPVKQVFEKLGLKPDFEFTSQSGDAPVNYIHRKLADGHLYFVANRRRFNEELVCSFRLEGYQPELWDANTGERKTVAVYSTENGITTLPLQLDPGGSVFVVFKKTDSAKRMLSIAKNGETLLSTKHFTQNGKNDKKQISNNFSVSLWVKPETDEVIPDDLGRYVETTRYTSSYPVFAPSGKQLFGDGHATFVLLAARNGVAVFEKADENLKAVLIAKMPISSWTHYTVVYADGQPSLYVNGEFIQQGEKSPLNVHPVIVDYQNNDKLFYYDGDLTPPKVFDYPISKSEIEELFEKGVPFEKSDKAVEPFSGENSVFLFWENGEYVLKSTTGETSKIVVDEINTPLELSGDWTVSFQENRGAPEQIVLPELKSLHTHPEDGVKYFSGTATYHKTFVADSSLISGEKRVFLDLGRIAVIAEVVLNGKELGIVWKPPYRYDITEFVKEGENELQVKVTNQWPNRLIGDEQLPVENEFKKYGPKGSGIVDFPDWFRQGKPKPAGGRVTFTTWRHFDEDSPLLEAGLIGPVEIRNAVTKEI
ncbi:glycosyl hydrolase [Maribellus sediminis]|uniref:glycosyl hydrolase n=1 Tax=Maribellus sediminis TaxID=2696285 RepID=UPI00142FEA33|nr:glycosyl hydrolase [Maribellus sediminis]